MPSAKAVWVWYQPWNAVSISAAYSMGMPSRSFSASQNRNGKSAEAAPKIKSNIIAQTSFSGLRHLTIGGQTLQWSVRRFTPQILR